MHITAYKCMPLVCINSEHKMPFLSRFQFSRSGVTALPLHCHHQLCRGQYDNTSGRPTKTPSTLMLGKDKHSEVFSVMPAHLCGIVCQQEVIELIRHTFLKTGSICQLSLDVRDFYLWWISAGWENYQYIIFFTLLQLTLGESYNLMYINVIGYC